jgi:hypothetical protein
VPRKEPTSRSLRELLSGNSYFIDYYQREYRWEAPEVKRLLDDIGEKFFLQFQSNHTRADVAKYDYYFIGDIILSRKGNPDSLYIVDGQQRLTTLTLLLIALQHRLDSLNTNRDHDEQIRKIDSLIISEHYGEKTFNLNIPERNKALENLYKKDSMFYEGDDLSVKQMYTNYELIKSVLSELIDDAELPFFADYLLEKIETVDIICPKNEEALEVFERMNDRGKPINPIDNLKGYIISNIAEEKKPEANKIWIREINKLRSASDRYEFDFFKDFLSARYAVTSSTNSNIRMDFQKVEKGRDLPGWVRDNPEKMRLLHRDDFYKFVTTDLPFYVSVYLKTMEAQTRPVPGLELVFFVSKLNHFKFFGQLSLAALLPADREEEIKYKLNILYTYLDIYLARRITAGKSIQQTPTAYDSNKLAVQIRELTDPIQLALFLKQKTADNRVNSEGFEELPSFIYKEKNKYLHTKWLLARVTDFLENNSGGGVTFEELMKKNYEVEHLIASNQFNDYDKEFPNIEEYERVRGQLGALILIRAGVNQSLQDKLYLDKIEAYRKENLLAQSLHSSAYKNHPRFQKLIKNYNLPFAAHEKPLTRDFIDQRNLLLIEIAKIIWNENRFDFALPKEHHVVFTGVKKKTKADMQEEYISPLIKGGMLSPGEILSKTVKGKKYTATVRSDGLLEGSNGKVGSPSGVARSMMPGRKSVSGWNFWKDKNGKSLKQLRDSLVKSAKNKTKNEESERNTPEENLMLLLENNLIKSGTALQGKRGDKVVIVKLRKGGMIETPEGVVGDPLEVTHKLCPEFSKKDSFLDFWKTGEGFSLRDLLDLASKKEKQGKEGQNE